MINRRNLSLLPRRSRVRINNISISFLLVLLLMLVGIEGVHGDPYEDVLGELRLMHNRINELEGLVRVQQEEIKELKDGQDKTPSVQTVYDGGKTTADADILETRLTSFKDELMDTLSKNQSPLEITGFFDFTLQDMDEGTQDIVGTRRERNKPFDYGTFELDLEYSYGEHYAVSTALVWDDGDAPSLAVGVVDYHLFDDGVPVRGRIFDEPGFHVQVGRFDIPYGVDYQYFASVDRPNISAPLTTERIQAGGYNSDGIRFYGTWKSFDYTAYAVNSLYGDDGGAVGGRIAFFPSRNPYRLHRFGSTRTLEVGFSYLKDLDKEFDARDRVYGFDFTLNYNMFTLVAEWMSRDSDEGIIDSSGILQIDEDKDESGFHISLVTDLEKIVKQPLYFFSRFDAWDPKTDILLDADDTTQIPIENLKRLTFGLGYSLTESLGLKLEYSDYQGQGTKEPSFEDSVVTIQLTASF